MPYRLLRDGYFHEETATGEEGQKIFIDDPSGGVSTLPVIGDAFGSPAGSTCKCRRIKTDLFGDPTNYKFRYTCTYSTPTGSSTTVVAGAEEQPIPENDPKRLVVGMEGFYLENYGADSAAIWETGSVPVQCRGKVRS